MRQVSEGLQLLALRVQLRFPVRRDTSRRPRNGLLDRVVRWRSEGRTGDIFVAPEVVEPILTRFEARNDRMRMLVGMFRRVLRG